MASATRPRGSRPLVRREASLLTPELLARRSGLHPEVVLRLTRLGLLEPGGGTAAAPLYRSQDAALLVRAIRLRGDLGLNYAGAVLASELLARIEELEQRLRAAAPTRLYRS